MLADFPVGRSGAQYPWLSWLHLPRYWRVCSHRDYCLPGLLLDANRHDAGLEPAVAHVKLRGRGLGCVSSSVRVELRHCLQCIRRLLECRARKGAMCRTWILSRRRA